MTFVFVVVVIVVVLVVVAVVVVVFRCRSEYLARQLSLSSSARIVVARLQNASS